MRKLSIVNTQPITIPRETCTERENVHEIGLNSDLKQIYGKFQKLDLCIFSCNITLISTKQFFSHFNDFQRNLSSVIKHVKTLMKSLNHCEVQKRFLSPFATEPTGKYLQLLHTQYFM